MKMIKRNALLLCMALIATFTSCISSSKNEEKQQSLKLRFAYFTDVHLNATNRGNGDEAFRKALADAKSKGAQFVLFGGDNIDCDRLNEREATADSLQARFKSIVDESGMKAYFTMGNHDRQYVFEGKRDTLGFKMYEKYFGKSEHVHFTENGVHFIILNALYPGDEGAYNVNPEQIEWLKETLKVIGKEEPIVISTHIPFLSLYYPVVEGNFKPLDMITNTKEVFEVVSDYNVKLVLQGHQHIYEQIYERDCWFITAGAISAKWWTGAFLETEEGYLMVDVDDKGGFSWEYIDYAWTPAK
ncbi:MAG: metallophosphoesterase [Rikenellaceae bacterium]